MNLILLFFVVVYRVGESISNLAYGAMQRVQGGQMVGRSLGIKGVITIALVGVALPVFSGNPVVAASIMAAISLFWALFRDMPRALEFSSINSGINWLSDFSKNWDLLKIVRLAKQSFPLGLDAGISSLALNAPKYFIEVWLGTESLGVFGLLWQLAYSLQKLVGAMGHAGVSMLSKYRHDNMRQKFWKLLNQLIMYTFFIGIAVVILGSLILPVLLERLLGEQYAHVSLVFALLLSSALAGLLRITGRASQACGKFKAYTWLDVLLLVVSIVSCWFFVQSYGLLGAAIALCISFSVTLVATFIYTYVFLWSSTCDVKSKLAEY